jgi:hypothetical protein
MMGAPVWSVRRSAQSVSHMLARNTSEQRRPRASVRPMPVMSSAARLNDVIRHSASTVNTPSEMLSRMMSVERAPAWWFFMSWQERLSLAWHRRRTAGRGPAAHVPIVSGSRHRVS